MAILFELLGWLLVDVLGEVLLELGIAAFQAAYGRENRSPLIATVGYLVAGAVLGALTLWLHPAPWIARGATPGFSLIVAPIVGGTAMHAWGRYRRAGGHTTTNLATFYGGAALLFGCALVRLVFAR